MPELGPDFFKRAIRGRYLSKVTSRSNVVRIAPDLSDDFPNEAAVNDALRTYRDLCFAFRNAAKPARGRVRKTA
jgi:hypothetical protein